MNIESLAVAAVKEAISKTDYLVDNINMNDKNLLGTAQFMHIKYQAITIKKMIILLQFRFKLKVRL